MKIVTQKCLLFQLVVVICNIPSSLQTPHCYVSKVSRSSDQPLCGANYFIFPETWNESSDDTQLMVDASKGQNETKAEDFTLCCPVAPDKVRGKLTNNIIINLIYFIFVKMKFTRNNLYL